MVLEISIQSNLYFSHLFLYFLSILKQHISPIHAVAENWSVVLGSSPYNAWLRNSFLQSRNDAVNKIKQIGSILVYKLHS